VASVRRFELCRRVQRLAGSLHDPAIQLVRVLAATVLHPVVVLVEVRRGSNACVELVEPVAAHLGREHRMARLHARGERDTVRLRVAPLAILAGDDVVGETVHRLVDDRVGHEFVDGGDVPAACDEHRGDQSRQNCESPHKALHLTTSCYGFLGKIFPYLMFLLYTPIKDLSIPIKRPI